MQRTVRRRESLSFFTWSRPVRQICEKKKRNRRIKTNAGIITKTSSSRLVGGTSFGYGFFSCFNRCASRASAGSDKEVSLLTAHCCCYYDHCINVCLFKTRFTAWIHSCVLYTRRCLCVAVAGGCVAVLALQLCASDPARRCVFCPFLCTTLTGGIRCQSPLTLTPCHKCRAIAPLMSLTHSQWRHCSPDPYWSPCFREPDAFSFIDTVVFTAGVQGGSTKEPFQSIS